MAKSVTLAILLLLSCPPAALAQADPEWINLAALGMTSIDGNRDGEITISEQLAYVEDVHVSMDSDENGVLSEGEFTSWGFGMSNLAAERGRLPMYEVGLRTMFDLWDGDDDDALSSGEHAKAVAQAFVHADTDENGLLNAGEYVDRFVYNVVSRNALR